MDLRSASQFDPDGQMVHGVYESFVMKAVMRTAEQFVYGVLAPHEIILDLVQLHIQKQQTVFPES